MSRDIINFFPQNGGAGTASSVPIGGKLELADTGRKVMRISGQVFARAGSVITNPEDLDENFWEGGRIGYSFLNYISRSIGTVQPSISYNPTSNLLIGVIHPNASGPWRGVIRSTDGGITWSIHQNADALVSTNKRLRSLQWNGALQVFMVVHGTDGNSLNNEWRYSADGLTWSDLGVFNLNSDQVEYLAISPAGVSIACGDAGGSGFQIRRVQTLASVSNVTVPLSGSQVKGIIHDGTNFVISNQNGDNIYIPYYSPTGLVGTWTQAPAINTTSQGWIGGPFTFSAPIVGGGNHKVILPFVRNVDQSIGFYFTNDSFVTHTLLVTDTTKCNIYKGFYNGLHYTEGTDGVIYTTTDFVVFTETLLATNLALPILITAERIISKTAIGGTIAGSGDIINPVGGFATYVRTK